MDHLICSLFQVCPQNFFLLWFKLKPSFGSSGFNLFGKRLVNLDFSMITLSSFLASLFSFSFRRLSTAFKIFVSIKVLPSLLLFFCLKLLIAAIVSINFFFFGFFCFFLCCFFLHAPGPSHAQFGFG